MITYIYENHIGSKVLVIKAYRDSWNLYISVVEENINGWQDLCIK